MRRILPLLIPLLFLMSCRLLNPQVMFKTPKDYPYIVDTTSISRSEYIIGPGDRIEMHFYTIDGFKLVDVTNSVSGYGTEAINYLVEKDSLVKLPILGNVALAGKTIQEAEKMLEKVYTKYYINPFIQIKITNRHAYVFFADGGRGTTVNIVNDNTSIIEVIALAGGLTGNSKAWRIKVIRGDLHHPTVRIIDMSTIEGMQASDLTVRSNDVIYIEATPDYKTKILAQLTPFITIVSSVLLIMNFVKR
jgi:polysaccharide export outer membrane protein